MTEYLEFELLERKSKTNVYAVKSRVHGDVLGTVGWFGRWRQYAFFPYTQTVYNTDCLRKIASFIEELMRQRKEAQKRTEQK